MKTPENLVKAKVKEVLTRYGAYFFLPVSAGYGVHGIPDFICCHKGEFVAIETKAPGKKPTALQVLQMEKITKAGGAWFLVDGDTTELEEWLECA